MARPLKDWIRKALAARARPACPECDGEGIVTYTARNADGEIEVACPCVERAMSTDDKRDEERVH